MNNKRRPNNYKRSRGRSLEDSAVYDQFYVIGLTEISGMFGGAHTHLEVLGKASVLIDSAEQSNSNSISIPNSKSMSTETCFPECPESLLHNQTTYPNIEKPKYYDSVTHHHYV